MTIENQTDKPAPIRHQPLELLVLVGFVVTWLITKDAIIATMVLTGGTVLQLIVMLALKMPLTKMQKTMFAAILIGGGLTILFQDPQFIKWKLTIVNTAFALILLVMQIMQRSPIKAMLESVTTGQDMSITMPDVAWSQITYIFIGFFATIALTNTYITLFMSFNAWVVFRSGLFVVSLIFLPAVLMLFFVKHKAIQQTSTDTSNDTIDTHKVNTNEENKSSAGSSQTTKIMHDEKLK